MKFARHWSYHGGARYGGNLRRRAGDMTGGTSSSRSPQPRLRCHNAIIDGEAVVLDAKGTRQLYRATG
jgi:hypothetical protein